jgi:hypothetical protein
MPIQVYERFDGDGTASTARGCQLYDAEFARHQMELSVKDDSKGDLWHTIEWDFAAPTWCQTSSTPQWAWQLKCDWRMPAHGILRFMHPIKDEAIEFRYDTPSLMLPSHAPGKIKPSSFTPELKKAWEELPQEWSCEVGKMTLTCTKDIVDAIEITPLGELYLYRPTELRIG